MENNNSKLNKLINKVKKAQEIYSTFTQEKVNEIFKAAAIAAASQRIRLATLAVKETKMGILEDKVIKNHFASEFIYNAYKDIKTCGVIHEDEAGGMMMIAEPIGIICGIIPVTNPTSTAIFKALLALKTRNGIIFSPHPSAKECTIEAIKLIYYAAVEAGAPCNIIGWIDDPSLELSNELMRHPGIDLILATGGQKMVKSAYSSGKPALGVGAGNTPVVIDKNADLKRAVSSILMSKTFDNGVICASEQSVILVKEIYNYVKKLFIECGAYILNEKEKEAISKVLLNDKGALNINIVGQSAENIATLAGITVPKNTKVLIGETEEISFTEVFAIEKLSPILGLYKAEDFTDAVNKAKQLIQLDGLGHTSVLHTDQDNNKRDINYFGREMKTCRILINQPASHGAIGDLYNFNLAPSLTLGCGSYGNNSVSENVGVNHLINRKFLTKRAENMLWHKLPKSIYFNRNSLFSALDEIIDNGAKKVAIITDSFLFNNGYTDAVTDHFEKYGIKTYVFFGVTADPTVSIVKKGAAELHQFEPDIIVALGGGSPMDAAKLMWVIYEHPEVKFDELALRFADIRKRVCGFPKLGKKAKLVCITTTSGTGSEVTPFTIVIDEEKGQKFALADYELTPHMAIVDANLVKDMPKSLCAAGGIDAITHAIEAYVSILATEYTDGHALNALSLLKKYLYISYKDGKNNPVAQEKVHNAATIAGMAFANAFLGICHSMAHKLGSRFHIPHGIANALLLTNVIRFNATDKPVKVTVFSQYGYPTAVKRYADIADHLKLTNVSDKAEQKVKHLIHWIEKLKVALDIPLSIQEWGVDENEFMQDVDNLAKDAFDDQCTSTNPRFPLIGELKQILIDSYYGVPYSD